MSTIFALWRVPERCHALKVSAVRRFESCTVIHDDRYSPVLISIWDGQATLDAARWHDGVTNEATLRIIDGGGKLVSISDATKSIRPTPELRRYWAENLQNADPRIRENTLATYVVINSPMMRGAITAIGWLSAEARRITCVATLHDAITGALEQLDAAGLARPAGLDPESYMAPVLDAEQVG